MLGTANHASLCHCVTVRAQVGSQPAALCLVWAAWAAACKRWACASESPNALERRAAVLAGDDGAGHCVHDGVAEGALDVHEHEGEGAWRVGGSAPLCEQQDGQAWEGSAAPGDGMCLKNGLVSQRAGRRLA